MAKKCNLSRNAIYNYEKNKRTPTISILIIISKALNISPTDLLDTNNAGKTSLIESDTINVEKENTTNSETKLLNYIINVF